jgi:hypothetical protein
MHPRNLNILDINDQKTETFVTGRGNAEHFNVQQIASWFEAQQVLAGFSIPEPDILLLDVSFDKDNEVIGAAIPANNQIVPVGPEIALPFLDAKTVMGFCPYSAHIDNQLLATYPPFLLGMGFIAAKMEGLIFRSKYLSGRKGPGNLDEFLAKLSRTRAGDTNTALLLALVNYRRHFYECIAQKRVVLIRGAELLRALVQLQKKQDVAGKHVEIPIGLGLEFIDFRGRPENIRLVSLFADAVGWNGRLVDGVDLKKILDWIEKITFFDNPLALALEVLDAQDHLERKTGSRPKLVDIIRTNRKLSEQGVRSEVFRLCILFANVHAACTSGTARLQKTLVFERLGTGVEHNTYKSWFGVRKKGEEQNIELLRGLDIPRLAFFNPDHVSVTERCFLSPGSVVSSRDHSMIEAYRNHYGNSDAPGADARLGMPWRNRPYSIAD